MSRLVESIRLQGGQFFRLPLHQERMNRALKELFGDDVDTQVDPSLQGRNQPSRTEEQKADRSNPISKWSLESILSSHSVPSEGLYKCRLVYDNLGTSVEFIPYTIRPVATLKIIRNDDIRYPHKFENRDELMKMWEMRGECDDVLVIRNGLVTDSSYANIVFNNGSRWITPKSFLLAGTMREYLLQTNAIVEEEIREEDIHRFTSFKLINALLEWNSPEYDVSNIH